MQINDKDIERALAAIGDDPPDAERFYAGLSKSHPGFVAYLMGSDTEVLTDEEHDYLLFLAMILHMAASPEDVDLDFLGQREDDLWESVNSHRSWSIESEAERVDDDDAWGNFLIDALAEDEENTFLTPAGREVLWVKLNALGSTVSG